MNRQEALTYLREHPVFWSRLGFGYDPPMKNEQGKPLVFTEDLDKYARFHRGFAAAGVKIQTCILHSGWMGVDEFDFSLTDRVVEAIFRDNPDSFFIPRIKLNVPIDWCRKYPEELLVYYEGPRDKESIRALVGTEKQDWLGYQAPKGYYQAGDYVDTRPNVDGVIALQSFSSRKWLQDAAAVLKRLVERLEQGPYAHRILGYHIAFGACGESVLWGRASNHYGDYGIAHTNRFLDWALEKYGSMDALRQVWGEDRFDGDRLILPSPAERYHRAESLQTFFRADPLGTLSQDMDIFLSKSCADAIEHFGSVIRKAAPEKLIGAFYGYYIHTDNPNYAGHLAWDQLLQSENVDFFAAPKTYYRTGPGQPGGTLCAAQSVNLHKLWVDETDVRTHLAFRDISESEWTGNAAKKQAKQPEWLCRDFRDSRSVLWREFCKNLSCNSSFWWMDLGGGWYDDPDLMEQVQTIAALNRTVQQPYESAADVLVLLDDGCIEKMSISRRQREGFMEDPLMELHRCGAVTDCYRLRDLPELDLRRYKMIVFAYTFDISETLRQELRARIPADAVLVFHHAAGVRKDGTVSLENIQDLTGFRMESRAADADYTALQVCDPAAEVCFRNEDGMPTVWKKANRYAITAPYPRAEVYRSMAEAAGCHLWTDCGQILWADNRLAGVFTGETLSGCLRFPATGTWREVISGQIFRNVSAVDLACLQNNAAVFLRA